MTSGSKTVRAPNSPRGIRAVAEARKSRFVSADSVCHCRVRAATPSAARAPQQTGTAQAFPVEAPERKRKPNDKR